MTSLFGSWVPPLAKTCGECGFTDCQHIRWRQAHAAVIADRAERVALSILQHLTGPHGRTDV